MPEPAHQIVLARIDWGNAYWDLECLHPSTDERFHVYRSGEVLGHHDECILRPRWFEYGLDMVADTSGPLTTPIPVDATWKGDYWKLTPRRGAPSTAVLSPCCRAPFRAIIGHPTDDHADALGCTACDNLWHAATGQPWPVDEEDHDA